MFNFIFPLIIILCLAGLFILILRKIPALVRLPESPEKELFKKGPFWQEFFAKTKNIKYSHWRGLLFNLLEKAWRKVKILILKLDNFTARRIEKTREKAQIMKVRSRAWFEEIKVKKLNHRSAKVQKVFQNNGAKKMSKEEECINLIAQNPKNVHAYKNLGGLYLKQGNLLDAKDCFEQVLKLEENDFEAKEKIEEIKKLQEL